jgi:hypothetical protein
MIVDVAKRAFRDFEDRYGFKVESSTANRIVFTNAFWKIIVVDNRLEADVFISDANERFKFHVIQVIEFLDPEADLGNGMTGLDQYALLMEQYMTDIFLHGQLAWMQEMSAIENHKSSLRQFINRNFPPGHDLIYLMNSGKKWVENVEKYMHEHDIKLDNR